MSGCREAGDILEKPECVETPMNSQDSSMTGLYMYRKNKAPIFGTMPFAETVVKGPVGSLINR